MAVKIGSSGRVGNPGGGSDLSWFNFLLENPACAGAVCNLKSKVGNVVRHENGLGCLHVVGRGKSDSGRAPRLCIDKNFRPSLDVLGGIHLPQYITAYHVTMLAAGRKIPSYQPPPLPLEFRKVTVRGGKTLDGAPAVWVASHLCHNSECVNVDHLV